MFELNKILNSKKNLISTKDLYMIELKEIIHVEYHSLIRYTSYYSEDSRYALVNKVSNDCYCDIFTGTKYNSDINYKKGVECIYKEKVVITDKEYITRDEAIYMLQLLNPTYISDVDSSNNNKVKKRILNK